jgi:Amiloride-sensitive sodium channel
LHFGVDSFQPLEKLHAFTFPDFLSNVGGFMGLLAGISVLSLIEIFYFTVKNFLRVQNRVEPKSLEFQNSRDRNVKALNQVSLFLIEFVELSDLHGLQYVKDKREGRVGMILWAAMVFLSFIACSFLIRDLFHNAEKSPVAIRINPQKWTLNEVRLDS